MDPLGFKKVVPAYWLYYRKHVLFSALLVLPWIGVAVASGFGFAMPTGGVLALSGLSLIAAYALAFYLPRRFRLRVLRTVDAVGDIGSVCSACLYVSDAIAEGEPCPECGRPHPRDVGDKWIFTGYRLMDEYAMKQRVRESAVLTRLSEPDSTASEANEGRPD